jgi:hypothetical protein
MAADRADVTKVDTAAPKPAIGQFQIYLYPDGRVAVDLPREDAVKALRRFCDVKINNSLCG